MIQSTALTERDEKKQRTNKTKAVLKAPAADATSRTVAACHCSGVVVPSGSGVLLSR